MELWVEPRPDNCHPPVYNNELKPEGNNTYLTVSVYP